MYFKLKWYKIAIKSKLTFFRCKINYGTVKLQICFNFSFEKKLMPLYYFLIKKKKPDLES